MSISVDGFLEQLSCEMDYCRELNINDNQNIVIQIHDSFLPELQEELGYCIDENSVFGVPYDLINGVGSRFFLVMTMPF